MLSAELRHEVESASARDLPLRVAVVLIVRNSYYGLPLSLTCDLGWWNHGAASDILETWESRVVPRLRVRVFRDGCASPWYWFYVYVWPITINVLYKAGMQERKRASLDLLRLSRPSCGARWLERPVKPYFSVQRFLIFSSRKSGDSGH